MTRPESLLSPAALASLESLARSAPPGDFVEVGVYKGGSAAVLYDVAHEQGRRLFLFDTFAGTPFQHAVFDKNARGSFSDCSEEEIRRLFPDARVIPGVFPHSLPRTHPFGPIAFVHADADQYRSTRAICDEMPRRMVKGGMILFDDYGENGCEGCTIAVDECFVDVSPERCNRIPETGKMLVRF